MKFFPLLLKRKMRKLIFCSRLLSKFGQNSGSYPVCCRREDCLEEDDNFLFDQDLDLEHFVPLEHIRQDPVTHNGLGIYFTLLLFIALWPVLRSRSRPCLRGAEL